ncbi:MAG: hypothetical protein CMJ93_00040 [Planctomycetes bacterium]|nr:hypothetical protein [Planctomycetota bacterium]
MCVLDCAAPTRPKPRIDPDWSDQQKKAFFLVAERMQNEIAASYTLVSLSMTNFVMFCDLEMDDTHDVRSGIAL